MGRPKEFELSLEDVVATLERAYLGKEPPNKQKQKELANLVSMPFETYRTLRRNNVKPGFVNLLKLAKGYDAPLDAFLLAQDPPVDGFLHEREGIRWRLRGDVRDVCEQALRLSAHLMLQGKSPEEISERLLRLPWDDDTKPGQLDEPAIRWRAEGGLLLGLVELHLDPGAPEACDSKLAKALENALRKKVDTPPKVTVVKTLASPSFKFDPAAPFLIARVAHHLVHQHLAARENDYHLGLSGGLHVATLIRTISATSNPFPVKGNRGFILHPMTDEPFFEHGLGLAVPLAADLEARAACLLGPKRVDVPRSRQGSEASDWLRQDLGRLSVAIYGCGDAEEDGWIRYLQREFGLPEDSAVTDVCLNLLDRKGELVPLPKDDGLARPLGPKLVDIQHIARSKEKLALMITSGESKGLPLAIAATKGLMNHLVCDQSAAKAAIAELEPARKGAARVRSDRG